MDSIEIENISMQHILETEYSEAEINAVRYGYQYRIEAEKHADGDCRFDYILPEASAVLLEIAKWVISGVAYDVIKRYATLLWDKLMKMKAEIPEDVNIVLNDEDGLRRFVRYVDEFNKKAVSASEKERSYIKEEIVADYMGKRVNEVYEQHHRMPTIPEYMEITKDAHNYANKMMAE